MSEMDDDGSQSLLVREQASEIARLRKRVDELEAQLDLCEQRLEVARDRLLPPDPP